MERFDLIVIGSGSAGLVAATAANRAGLSVAMLEKSKIGGECTHSGCVPSKAFLQSAKQWDSFQKAQTYGLPAMQRPPSADFSSVMNHVQSIIDGIYEHEKPEVWQGQGIHTIVHESGARFIDEHTIEIGPHTLHGKYIIICTGSSPRIVNFPCSAGITFLTNENFWDLREQPNSIVFIGGGVISAELGQGLAKLGTEVTILDRNDRILKIVDQEVAEVLYEQFDQDGLKRLGKVEVREIVKEGTDIFVHIEADGQAQTIKTEAVFQAVGRIPNLMGMDLEKAGVEFTDNGIRVNEYLQTTTPHIYACGDVATPAKFTHVAAYQAQLCVDNILQDNVYQNDLNILPWAIFTAPEVAHVGMSEAEAEKQYGDQIQVFKVDATIDRFVTDQATTGFLKVVFGPNDTVLGADAIGAHAGEWTQMITLVMKNNIPLDSFVYTIYSYPTYSEIVKKVFTRYLRTKSKTTS